MPAREVEAGGKAGEGKTDGSSKDPPTAPEGRGIGGGGADSASYIQYIRTQPFPSAIDSRMYLSIYSRRSELEEASEEEEGGNKSAIHSVKVRN